MEYDKCGVYMKKIKQKKRKVNRTKMTNILNDNSKLNKNISISENNFY